MKLSKETQIYIGLISVFAASVMFFLLTQYQISDWETLVFWSSLAVVTESLSIVLPSGVGISVNLAISLASITVGGPLTAAVVSGLGFAISIVKEKNNKYSHIFNTPFYRTAFNSAQGIIATGVAGIAYMLTGGKTDKFYLLQTLIILPVYMILNSVIIAKLMSLISSYSFLSVWVNNMRGFIPSMLAVGSVGIIIAMAYKSYGPIAVMLFFGPLLFARFSFKMYIDLRNTYIETIQALNRFMEAKDAYTSGHAMRVKEYAVMLATAAELPEGKVRNIEKAAILHDIGKIGIDDNILKKPFKLTKVEYEEIQKHPVIGAEILSEVDFLKDISKIIRHHHERYDGKGYPDGLKGAEISVESSILAIADVYDAMTSSRPYRDSLGKDVALKEISVNAGTQFNPDLANKFVILMSA